MASCNTEWLQFFKSAGIPNLQSAEYTHLFVKNRITLDMLPEISKELLQEMGIYILGDIISILRHSKVVCNQTAREKILAHDKPINTNPISTASTSLPKSTRNARRVLPEHEGKYKVILPTGSTKQSKAILAKKHSLHADKLEKTSIFNRLTKNHNSKNHEIGIEKAAIFNRLGEFSELSKKAQGKTFELNANVGIYETPYITAEEVTKHAVQRRLLLGKEFNHRPMEMDVFVPNVGLKSEIGDDKQVSFSKDVKVHFYTEPKLTTMSSNSHRIPDGVKSRLGKRDPLISLKKHTFKASSIDVHSRLHMTNVKRDSSVFNRLGNNTD